MLGRAGINRFGWRYSLATAPSTSEGQSVVPGTGGSKGSYTQLASGANLTEDVYGLLLWINSGATANALRDIRLDIGIDPAGGTSYTVKIADLLCGQAAAVLYGGQWYWFPIYIKAGSSIGARAQSTVSTAFNVSATFYGRPSNPAAAPAGQWCETVGTLSGDGGVAFTPGDSGTEGNWTSLGTTTRACWFWQLSVQASDNSYTASAYHFDLAWGDGSNLHMIIENKRMTAYGTAEANHQPMMNPFDCFADVPAGATLYVRGTCNIALTATGWNAVAHGIGG